MKRIVSLLLCVIMALSILPLEAFAEGEAPGESAPEAELTETAAEPEENGDGGDAELNGFSVWTEDESIGITLAHSDILENQAIIAALNGNLYEPLINIEVSGLTGSDPVQAYLKSESLIGQDAARYKVVRLYSEREAACVSASRMTDVDTLPFTLDGNGTYVFVRLKGVELDPSGYNSTPPFFVEFVSGASKVGDRLVWTADNPASGHRFVFRINYRLIVYTDQEPDAIRMTIPEHILRDRLGALADDFELSVPTKEEADSDSEYAEGVYFAWRRETDDQGTPTGNLILYNFREIENGTRSGFIELAYYTSKTTLDYRDYDPEDPAAGRSDDFHAVLSLPNKEDKDSEHIPVYINTNAVVTSVSKTAQGVYDGWQSSWGDPADFGITDPDSGRYIVWAISTNMRITQPYSLTIRDIPITDGLTLVGFHWGGERRFTPADENSSFTVENQRSTSRWDYALTRVDKSAYTDISGAEVEKWSVTNSAISSLKPFDEVDPVTTASGRGSYSYEKPKFYDPDGHFNAWKRGDGAARSGAGIGGVFAPLSFVGGIYSRYDLDQFGTHDGMRGPLETYDGFDYAVWMTGTPYLLTKDWNYADDPDKDYGYFREYVIYDQWDYDVKLGHSASDVVSIGKGDYRIKSLQFNISVRNEKLNQSAQRFGSASGGYDAVIDENDAGGGIGDVLFIYGQTAEGEWVRLLKKDWHEGGETWVNSEYAALSGLRLTFLESEDHSKDILYYRTVMKSRHAEVSVGTVPEYELFDSEKVLSIADEAGVLCLYNATWADLYSTWEGQTKNVSFSSDGSVTGVSYSGEDYRAFPWTLDLEDGDTRQYYRYFHIQDAYRRDYDYARMSETQSSIAKRVTATGNDRKMARFVVSWQVRMTETITASEGTDIFTEPVMQDGGVFYDLLPKGSVLDTKTLRVRSNGADYAFTYELTPNWRGSGRTMLKVVIKDPGIHYTLSYETIHSWASVREYGNAVYNPVAYETGNGSITGGSADDASGLSGSDEERGWMASLDPESAGQKRFLYADARTSIAALMATSVGTSKSVRAFTDTQFKSSAFIDQNGVYVYKLTYAPDTVLRAKNLLFIDNLEDANAAGRQWQGVLYSADPEHPEYAVDVTQLKSVGANPTVYFADHSVRLTNYADGQAASDFLAEKGFSEMSEFLGSHTLEDVKSVAIYCGDSFEMKGTLSEPNKTLTAYLYMKAPEYVAERGNPYPATFNNLAFIMRLGLSGEDGTIEFIPQVTVTPDVPVFFRITADVPMIKISQDDPELTIPDIKFKLTGASYYTGRQIELYETTAYDGSAVFSNIERGSYYIEEVASTRDWVLRKLPYQVFIDGYGRLWAADLDVFKTTDGEIETDAETGKPLLKDGSVAPESYMYSASLEEGTVIRIENEPRMYADFSLYKVGKRDGRPIGGVEFSLEGRSHYDNMIYKTAVSSDDGEIFFSDVEWGEYRLTETQTTDGYRLLPADVEIIVEVGGDRRVKVYERSKTTGEPIDSSEWVSVSELGDILIMNREKYSAFSFYKAERVGEGLRYLPGAAFSLRGTSADGNAVERSAVSDENGVVEFTDIEEGVYELRETAAPSGIKITDAGLAEKGGQINYQGDTKTYNVFVYEDGSFKICERRDDGTLGAELGKNDEGKYVFLNSPLAEGQIVITKKWKDGLTGNAAANRPYPQLTLMTEAAFFSKYYTVTFDAFGGYFETGGSKYAIRYRYDELPTAAQHNAVPIPKRTNYEFAGWVYRLKDDDELHEFSLKDYDEKATITVYAKWIPSRSWVYPYTGYTQTFTAPITGDYFMQAWGADGGDATVYMIWARKGGKGAYTSGTIHLEAGQMIYVYVGGAGQTGFRQRNAYSRGGWNGGGNGANSYDGDEGSGAGGGATDFRLVDGTWNSFPSLKSRIMVAGGGGGGVALRKEDGGRLLPISAALDGQKEEMPLTQVSGFAQTYKASISAKGVYTTSADSSPVGKWLAYGSFGIGGSVSNTVYSSIHSIGGAGGGWYGGIAGSTNYGDSRYQTNRHYGACGTGGTSYVSGYEGCFAVNQSSTSGNITHRSDSEYQGFVFTDPVILAGYERSSAPTKPTSDGNGYAKITYVVSEEYQASINYPEQTLIYADGAGLGPDDEIKSLNSTAKTDASGNPTSGYWEKNSDDTWTYHFMVVDPYEDYVVFEDDGLYYSAYGYRYVSEEMTPGYIILPGSVTTATVTNGLPTGSLYIMKSIVGGNNVQRFRFTVTLKNSAGRPVNGVYGGVSFRDGTGSFYLSDGDSMLITGLPAGFTYSVSEETAEGYTAAFSPASPSGRITANATATVSCVNTYTAPRVDPVDITLRKLVVGHFENSGTYELRADFRGIGVNIPYSYTVGTETYSFTSDENGNCMGIIVSLEDGESVTFERIPVGAQYRFSEPAGDYYSSWAVTDESGGTEIVQSASLAPVIGIENSTEWEMADEHERVTVTFTNRLEKTVDLSVTKIVDGRDRGEAFSITILLQNLEPGEIYSAVKSGDEPFIWVVNDEGEIIRTLDLYNGEILTIFGLPIGTVYRVAERDFAGYTPSICVNGTDTPLVRVRPDEGFENGMGTAELTVHEGDSLKVTITNSSRLGALRISKTVAGSFGDRFAKFPFRIELTQLQGGTVKPLTDTELIVIKKNGEVIGDEFADGVLEIELGHGDVLLIEGIYDGVYYSVSETDYGYYEVSVSGLSEGTIRSGVNGGLSEVDFTNTRDGIIPTGTSVSVARAAGLCLAASAGAALITAVRKRRRARDWGEERD